MAEPAKEVSSESDRSLVVTPKAGPRNKITKKETEKNAALNEQDRFVLNKIVTQIHKHLFSHAPVRNSSTPTPRSSSRTTQRRSPSLMSAWRI